MNLTRDQIQSAARQPVDTIPAPKSFGEGTITIRGVSMADEYFQAYISAPVLRPEDPDAEPANLIKAPSGANAKEKAAYRSANVLIGQALSRQYTEPNADERSLRIVVGTFIMGVIDENGEPLYTFKDARGLRDNSIAPYVGVGEVADAIIDLSNAAGSIEESKSGPPG